MRHYHTYLVSQRRQECRMWNDPQLKHQPVSGKKKWKRIRRNLNMWYPNLEYKIQRKSYWIRSILSHIRDSNDQQIENAIKQHLHLSPSDVSMSSLLSCCFQWLKHLVIEAAELKKWPSIPWLNQFLQRPHFACLNNYNRNLRMACPFVTNTTWSA